MLFGALVLLLLVQQRVSSGLHGCTANHATPETEMRRNVKQVFVLQKVGEKVLVLVLLVPLVMLLVQVQVQVLVVLLLLCTHGYFGASLRGSSRLGPPGRIWFRCCCFSKLRSCRGSHVACILASVSSAPFPTCTP